jgi:hypothetical protein
MRNALPIASRRIMNRTMNLLPSQIMIKAKIQNAKRIHRPRLAVVVVPLDIRARNQLKELGLAPQIRLAMGRLRLA